MKNLILTGSTSGLGFALFKSLINKNYNLILISKNKKKLIQLKKKYNKKKNIYIYPVDISEIVKLKKVIDKILKKFKHIDVLINNAGVLGPIGKIEKNNWSKWTKTINTNLLASVLLIKNILPSMKKKKFGRIIQLSGGGATKSMPNFSAYAVSKTGIVRFVETIADECMKNNITINAVAPGAMNTNMLNSGLKAGRNVVGKNYYRALMMQKKTGGVGFEKAIKLIEFLINNKNINGKLISAIWDNWRSKNFLKKSINKNMFTLRRKI